MLYLAAALAFSPAKGRKSELLSREETEALGIVWKGNSSTVSSHDLLTEPATYPTDFTWGDKEALALLRELHAAEPPYAAAVLKDIRELEAD